MRILIRVLFLGAAVALVFPFIAASFLVDRKGVLVQGQVFHKDEWISVGYSSWTRHADLKVEYDPPDGYGAGFMDANPDEEQFDRLRKGDTVEIRYLLAKDLPNWPGMKTMRQMHLLPVTRLATEHTWSGPGEIVKQAPGVLIAIAMGAILLVVWRMARLPFFPVVVGLCVVTAIVCGLVAEFPKPTPTPVRDVKTATGTVKSVEYWKELFRSAQSRSSIGWTADQPIAVVGVEFVPEGRSEPVVAVDLIDEGSVSGLAEHARVSVEYESRTPRLAQLLGARRQFAQKNFRGLLEQGAGMVLVTAVLLGGAHLFGRWYRSLGRAKG